MRYIKYYNTPEMNDKTEIMTWTQQMWQKRRQISGENEVEAFMPDLPWDL